MKNSFTKFLLIAVIVVVVASFFYFDLGQYLTFDYLKSQQTRFQEFYAQNQIPTLAAYIVIYIAVTALSLPGATILTLAGGALFGFWVGLITVSFASTIGATLAFLVARFLLRDYVQKKFGNRLRTINQGIERDGVFYLFTLRLIPLFPFFVINLVMGLTPIRTLQFFFVSQIGMLAGTAVYVNAGTQIGQLESPAGILSFELLLSFALLGIFPLIAKKVISYVKGRKYLRRYPKPKSFDYNIIVIGAGSAGLVSAYIAAAVKAKVALIEKHKMGGDCLNTGCVPSKAIIKSAKLLSYAKRAQEFGFDQGEFKFDFAKLMDRVQRVIKTIEPHDSVERYTNLGVNCFRGDAKLLSPYEVEITKSDGSKEKITGKNIILATGAEPFVPPIPGLDKIQYLTSDNLWEIRTQPKRLLVLGGGPIGSELAQTFQRLGSQVIQVERNSRIMGKEDPEVSQMVMDRFLKEGIELYTDHNAKEFKLDGDRKILIAKNLKEPGKTAEIEFDEVLIAIGRIARTKGFGLSDLEIQLAPQGTIQVDDFLRTNYPNIYVCGDAAGPYQFTHTAAHQAWFAAVNALFSPLKSFKVDYRVIPWCTFTDPEVAQVGLNESAAKAQGVEYEVTKYGIDDLDRAIADEEAHGMVKVLTRPGTDKIIGCTIVGAHAGDLIAEYVAAMKHGFGLNKILGTIHIYPTLAEANKFAAGNWKKAHAPKGALRLLEKFHSWRRS